MVSAWIEASVKGNDGRIHNALIQIGIVWNVVAEVNNQFERFGTESQGSTDLILSDLPKHPAIGFWIVGTVAQA